MSPRQGQIQLIEWHLILLDKGIEPAPVDFILEGCALFPLGNLFLGWIETILFPQDFQLLISPFLHGGVEPHHPGLCRHALHVGEVAIPKIIIQRLFKGLGPGDISPDGGGQLLLVEPHPGQVARDLRHHQLVAVDLHGGIIFPQQCFALGEQLIDLHGKVGKVGQRVLQSDHHGALGIRYARLVGSRRTRRFVSQQLDPLLVLFGRLGKGGRREHKSLVGHPQVRNLVEHIWQTAMRCLHGAGKTAHFHLPHPGGAQTAALFHLMLDAPRPALGRISEGEGMARRVEQMPLASLALADEGRSLYLVLIKCLGLFVIDIEPAIAQLAQGITALFQLERHHKACSGGDWVRLLLWRGERLIQGITHRDDGNLLVLERTDSCRALAVGRVCTLGGLIGRTHAS